MCFLIVVCDCSKVQHTPPFANTFFCTITQELIQGIDLSSRFQNTRYQVLQAAAARSAATAVAADVAAALTRC